MSVFAYPARPAAGVPAPTGTGSALKAVQGRSCRSHRPPREGGSAGRRPPWAGLRPVGAAVLPARPLVPLTSWERGLPARENAPDDFASFEVRQVAAAVPWRVSLARTGRPRAGSLRSLEARGPGLSFVCNQDETWGRLPLTAGAGASCEEGTFLASRGQVSENEVRSFHIHGHLEEAAPGPDEENGNVAKT